MIVGLTGYAQHGKDSLGKLFVEAGYTKMAFADALRKCVATLNPIVGVDHGTPITYIELLDSVGYEEAKKNPEVRRLLQVFGTEVARDILGEDTWVNALAKAWFEAGRPNLVITDVRFPNEADFVHRNGGLLVEVIRLNEDGTPFDNGIGIDHPSERFIRSLPVDSGIVAANVGELKMGFDMLCESRGLL